MQDLRLTRHRSIRKSLSGVVKRGVPALRDLSVSPIRKQMSTARTMRFAFSLHRVPLEVVVTVAGPDAELLASKDEAKRQRNNGLVTPRTFVGSKGWITPHLPAFRKVNQIISTLGIPLLGM